MALPSKAGDGHPADDVADEPSVQRSRAALAIPCRLGDDLTVAGTPWRRWSTGCSSLSTLASGAGHPKLATWRCGATRELRRVRHLRTG